MALTINTNAYSLNAQRNLSSTQSALATTMQRLSSGLRINSAKDDAAGLAISERINAQVKGMTMAQRNANDGISMMQVADGAAAQVGDNLQRMRELAVQASNGTYGSSDRANLQVEFAALGKEITRIAQNTKFNGKTLLDSTAAATSFSFQIGAGTGTDNQITFSTMDVAASTMSIDSGTISITGSTGSTALAAIANLDCAINTITTNRASFGAAMNRTSAVVSALSISIENQTAAKGRITDTDFATETANLSRAQILQQAGTAMLAQANAVPQNVLSLLR